MNEQLRYRVDGEVKTEYERFVTEKHGPKLGTVGKNIENAMKLYLVVNGASGYSDDPDVQELLGAAKKIPCAHTQQSSEPKNEVNDLVEQIKEMKEELAEVKRQLAEREPTQNQRKIAKEQGRYRDHSMDGLVSSFYDEYGEDEQVSYNDISKLVMKVHGVLDKRSIMNRVEYLIGNGYLEPFAPNVFNIK